MTPVFEEIKKTTEIAPTTGYTIEIGKSPADTKILNPAGEMLNNVAKCAIILDPELNQVSMILNTIEPNEPKYLGFLGEDYEPFREEVITTFDPIIKVKIS
jgi:hypothetical protein